MPQEPRGPTHLDMQYQVLARKWRPQNFHELVGQEHVSRTLLNALQSGRVAHAFLFSGPRGSGKTTTARILAKALNCRGAKPGEPCGQCVACTEIAAGNCLDVMEIDAASNRGIDEIRELREKVRYKPARDKNKIFVIDEVHMLTPEAFNALLKTLEEPPPHVIFIMATTEYHKIPATILSRCQQYSFKLIPFPLILERLRKISDAENIRISKQSLELVTFSSGGSMRDAMSALDQVIAFSGDSVRDEDVAMLLGLVEPAILGDMVRAIAADDAAKILQLVAGQEESGQDLANFCRRLMGQFRNLMVLKSGVSDSAMLGVPESLLPELQEQAALFSRVDLLRLFDALLKVEGDLKYAAQIRFHLEMGLIEIGHISRMRPIEELIDEFKELLAANASGSSGGKPLQESSAAASGPGWERSLSPVALKPSAIVAPGRFQPAAIPPPAPPVRLSKTEDPAPPGTSNVATVPQGTGSRELLVKIAGLVRKPSFESVLLALPGAELRGNMVVLEIGPGNEFYRRQVTENLDVLVQAASSAVGRTVQVTLAGESISPGSTRTAGNAPAPSLDSTKLDPLERAKREPIVRSFLEMFPGPVKSEENDS